MGQARIVCGNCGTVNNPGEQYCVNCGYNLASGPTGPIPHVAPTNRPIQATTSGGRRITGALAAGNVISGRYRIVQLMGKGGFGAVYKALDERFKAQRVVAIKEMSDAQLTPKEKAEAIQAFSHEADLLVELNHPNLPNVSDFFEEAGKAYLAMEFIEGKTLEKLQEEAGGPLAEDMVMGWALQLCTVLDYLHTLPQPIIFRDMKPSNVMVTKNGQIKLIDFGIARIFKASMSKDTTLLGSQGYAPLEQYGRGQSDARSDIYALGATLYDLLTHELPADAPSRRIHAQILVEPRQLNPRISQATEAIVLKAMADEPKDRFQSAAEMYQAIIASGVAPAPNIGFSTSGSLSGIPAARPVVPIPPVATNSQTTSQPAKTRRAGQANMVPPPPPIPTASGAAFPSSIPQRQGISRRGLLIGGAVAVVAVAAGGFAVFTINNNNNKSKTGGVGTQTTKPAGTINLNFTYSTEKNAWLDTVIKAFNQSDTRINNKTIQVIQDSRGSVDAINHILDGSLKPVAWSPASSLELNQLSTAWQQKNSGQDIIIASGDLLPHSLVLSPLVFGVWKDRAQLLLKKYGSIDWSSVHDAVILKNGWKDLGGPDAWQLVKLGQTRPDQSNSGLLSITLLAYTYYKAPRKLTIQQIQDPAFLKYFYEVQDAVQMFGRSSGTYLLNEVIGKGPASYDITVTYENLVLTNQQQAMSSQGQPLLVSYPTLNIVSDHPFAILQGNWITTEDQTAAKTFRDYLLAESQQRLALVSGFRPTNSKVSLKDKVTGNPFLNQPSDVQVKDQLPVQVQTPGGDVVNELIKQWQNHYSDAPTSTS